MTEKVEYVTIRTTDCSKKAVVYNTRKATNLIQSQVIEM